MEREAIEASVTHAHPVFRKGEDCKRLRTGPTRIAAQNQARPRF